MEKLISLNEFVAEIEKYAAESKNYERASKLICAYNDFLLQPVSTEMFEGENSLFTNAKIQITVLLNPFNRIMDLVGKIEYYNNENEQFGWSVD
jgi:hypothetical protein